MTLLILPARALRPMGRPMHLQSVHMIDHHHCLRMEGRGAWGGDSDRGAWPLSHMLWVEVEGARIKSVLPRTPPPCFRRRMAIFYHHLI